MKTPLQLHELPIGSRAVIAGYGMINEFAERLQELGLIPGTLIKIVRRAPFKGPVEISYGTNRVAVRANESNSIFVECLN